MNRLDNLIADLCPDGVEYTTLGNITHNINIGINPRNFFKLNPDGANSFYVTVRELNGLQGVKQYEKTDLISEEAVKIISARAQIEKGDILFSNTGTVGKMALVPETPLDWGVNEGIYVIKPKQIVILSKFLYYFLSSNHAYKDYSAKFTGSTLKHITQKALANIIIPTPPIPVQEEIVRILDTFTTMEAALEAELKAREKQYIYYRDLLMNDKCFEWDSLSEVGLMKRGTYVTKQSIRVGDIPVILGGQQPAYYCDISNHEGEAIVISRSGEYAGFVSFWDEPIFVTDGFIIETTNKLKLKFLYFYLKNIQDLLHQSKRGGGVPHVRGSEIMKIQVPVPTLDEQELIVDILNRFDTLVNDISKGLPAEIEARKIQYEYYRNKLLTFKEKVS